MEEWRDIVGYEGCYMISSLGRVKSFKRRKQRILKTDKSSDGYLRVSLSNGSSKNFKIHQLMAITFLNHKPCGLSVVIDHINEDKEDNRLKNLQLVTHRYNTTKSTDNKTKGAYFNKRKKYWYSLISINGKQIYLGSFKSEIEAGKAYQQKLASLE